MKTYIGWDSREPIAYNICEYSIHKYNPDVVVEPIKLSTLREQALIVRPQDVLGSTEFTFSRFFVPYLNGFKGWALFADCDFLWLSDIKEIFDLADPSKALMCVKHTYVPKEKTKMDGKVQHIYPRKNWSSLMLFNCEHPANSQLVPGNLNEMTYQSLHRMEWLDDSLIGEIPHHYNWLVDWYKEPKDGAPKVLHYTSGGPYFRAHRHTEYAGEWLDMFQQFMGRSFMDTDFVD